MSAVVRPLAVLAVLALPSLAEAAPARRDVPWYMSNPGPRAATLAAFSRIWPAPPNCRQIARRLPANSCSPQPPNAAAPLAASPG